MITITLNEQPIKIEDNFNILQLLQQVKSPLDGIAVAINNSIISKNIWEKIALKSNDKILIIQATQGG